MQQSGNAPDGDGSDVSRRKFLVAGSAAAWSSVALAGCSTNDQGASPTASPTATPTPAPENYVVTDEMIVSSEYVPPGVQFVSACAPSRTFAPGMVPVFKVGVFDPATGDQLTNEDLDSVAINLDGGPTVDLQWAGDDEEHAAQEWTGHWKIPTDTEPGAMKYTVEITDGDANFRDVGILESSFTVIDYNDPRNYIITDDLYAGSAGIPEDAAFVSSCAPSRTFAPGMMVGFDIGIYDGTTGNPVGPTDFDYEGVVAGIESAELTIPDRGVTKELAWSGGEGEHSEKGEDLYWNGVWHIPSDAETGSVKYEVKVQTDVSTKMVGALENTFSIINP